MDEVHRSLLDQPLVRSLAPLQVGRIRQITRWSRFPADMHLFRAGEPADDVYLLCHGRVAVQMNQITIATLGPSELLGAAWLLPPRTWTCDACAIEPVGALAIDAAHLTTLCEQDPSLGYRLLREIGCVLEGRFLHTALQTANLYADWS